MLISKTYLKSYEKIIKELTLNVNIYFKKHNISNNDLIKTYFYLRFLKNKTKFYNKIIIFQKNKKRILYEPSLHLKYIQKYILNNILNYNINEYRLNSCVTGFLKNKNIIDNIKPHLNKITVIKMDIKDFFPNISRERIYKIFRKYNKFNYEYSYLLSHLVTYKNQLPQGAPTSPFLANICANGIDNKILTLLRKINKSKNINIQYTRYADDLTISFDKKFNYDYIINSIIDIIFSEGFYPNFKKIKVIKHSQCQKVTGIVINNETPSIEYKERNKIKFILNIWDKYGIDSAIKVWNSNKLGTIINKINNSQKSSTNINYEHLKFMEIMNGKIEYFQMVNKKQNIKIIDKFYKLENETINKK